MMPAFFKTSGGTPNSRQAPYVIPLRCVRRCWPLAALCSVSTAASRFYTLSDVCLRPGFGLLASNASR